MRRPEPMNPISPPRARPSTWPSLALVVALLGFAPAIVPPDALADHKPPGERHCRSGGECTKPSAHPHHEPCNGDRPCDRRTRGDAAAPSGGSRGTGFWIAKYQDRLGLSDAKLEELREVSERSRRESDRLREAFDREHRALSALLNQDLPVEKDVMAQVERVAAVELEMSKSRLRAILAIRSLLTQDQRRELMKIRDEWRARHDPS